MLESSCQYVELERERGVYFRLFSMCDYVWSWVLKLKIYCI